MHKGEPPLFITSSPNLNWNSPGVAKALPVRPDCIPTVERSAVRHVTEQDPRTDTQADRMTSSALQPIRRCERLETAWACSQEEHHLTEVVTGRAATQVDDPISLRGTGPAGSLRATHHSRRPVPMHICVPEE
jgi:hypothetical protein